MISFRQYLVREGRGDDVKRRTALHVKHHNTCDALKNAFPGEEALDDAMLAIYTKWRGKGNKPEQQKKTSLRKFIADDDRKWAKLWGAVRADAGHDKEE